MRSGRVRRRVATVLGSAAGEIRTTAVIIATMGATGALLRLDHYLG